MDIDGDAIKRMFERDVACSLHLPSTTRYVYEPPPLPRAAMEADLEADIQAITATLHEGNAISYALLEDRGPDILDVTRDIARGG